MIPVWITQDKHLVRTRFAQNNDFDKVRFIKVLMYIFSYFRVFNSNTYIDFLFSAEFEDTEEVIRSHKSLQDRQRNGEKTNGQTTIDKILNRKLKILPY